MDADRIADRRTIVPPPGAPLPRGIRDCNPGNLRPGTVKWIGEIDPDGGYCRFYSAFYGIRALARNLFQYQAAHGLDTVAQIITRWAPPADNNDTAAYIAAVALACGVGADDPIALDGVDMLSRLATAIIHHENGMQPYTADEVQDAVMHALALQ